VNPSVGTNGRAIQQGSLSKQPTDDSRVNCSVDSILPRRKPKDRSLLPYRIVDRGSRHVVSLKSIDPNFLDQSGAL